MAKDTRFSGFVQRNPEINFRPVVPHYEGILRPDNFQKTLDRNTQIRILRKLLYAHHDRT